MSKRGPTATTGSDDHPALLPWYVAGSLSAVETSEVEAHLESCAACREEVEALASMRDTLRHYVDLDNSLAEVLASETVPGRPRDGRWKVAFWAAAALLLVLIPVSVFRNLKPEPSVRQLQSVNLLPASRGSASPSEDGAVLRGQGPWVVNVFLPSPEDSGELRLTIESEGRIHFEDVVTSDVEGRVTLVVRSLAGPGEYRIRLEFLDGGDRSSASYPLSVRP